MKVRIVYEKGDSQRFLGHLEVMRAVVMSLRRAGWPVEMTRGYTPRPRVEMVSPLPVGTAGFGEVADVYLAEERPLTYLEDSLRSSLLPGFRLQRIDRVPPDEPALERRIIHSFYRLLVYGAGLNLLRSAVERFRDTDEALFRPERPDGQGSRVQAPATATRDRGIDLRPFISKIEVAGGEMPVLEMVVRHFEGRTVRPAWVLGFLVERCGLREVDPREAVIDRLWLEWGDGSSHGSGDPRKSRWL